MNQEDLNRRVNEYVRDMDEIEPSGDPLMERTYARIKKELRDARSLKVPHQQLVDAMQRECGAKSGWFHGIHNCFETLPSTAFTCACFILVAFAVWISVPLLSPSPSVKNVEWISLDSKNPVPAPWLWKKRLGAGRIVEVPTNIETRLQLTDGSILSASPDSLLAVRYNESRLIVLQSGELTVEAQPDPQRLMTVQTPLFDVQVTGTVFSISLTP